MKTTLRVSVKTSGSRRQHRQITRYVQTVLFAALRDSSWLITGMKGRADVDWLVTIPRRHG